MFNFIAIFTYNDYLAFLVLFFLACVLSLILFIASYYLGYKDLYREKLTTYECGFAPFEDAREKFDIRFYLVAILFIVFDLEISFLFPWSIILSEIGFSGYLSMYFFLYILTVGFVYEWFNGALDWE